jgi:hypothetical protein
MDYYTVSGTALEGVDFVATRGTLTFEASAGWQSRTIVIPLLVDTEIESRETFHLVLTNALPDMPFQPGVPLILTLQIADVPAGYRFATLLDNPSQNWVEVNESEPAVRVAVRRIGYASTTGSVRFSTENGTAEAGEDFEVTDGTLDFPPGTAELWITVPLINDGRREAIETFRIRLSEPAGDTPIVDTNLTVRILDNDPGLQFAYSPFYVGEQYPETVLSVWRGADQLDPASVAFQTEDNTAIAGQDYVATSGVLEFAAGETFKEIRVPILNDALRESEESFRVRLFDPSPGTSLGNPSLVTVIFQDNETGYEPRAVSIPVEGGGDFGFRVVRNGDFTSTYRASVSGRPRRDQGTAAVRV